MICDCAPLKWVSRWRDRGYGLWVARDREVRKKSNRVLSIYGEEEEAWSKDLRTKRREDKRKI